MTSLSRLILEQYLNRKTKKQKDAFIALMQSHFPEITVQEGSFPKCRNLIFGDVENAKVILTAHYDTGSVFQLPDIVAPKSILLTLLFDIIRILPLIGLLLFANILLGLYTDSLILHYGISLALYVIYLLVPLLGPATKNTVNKNTSGVVTLCELISTLSSQQLNKVAFVFFDRREFGFLGSSLFHKRFKNIINEKLLINIDSISSGDHLLISASKRAQIECGKQLKTAFAPTDETSILFAEADKTYYLSDQMNFKYSVAITALKYARVLGYYQQRNDIQKDATIDQRKISMVCNGILRFLKSL